MTLSPLHFVVLIVHAVLCVFGNSRVVLTSYPVMSQLYQVNMMKVHGGVTLFPLDPLPLLHAVRDLTPTGHPMA